MREALAACRAGDIVVTKLDRLARSLPDARDYVEDLTCRQVTLNLDGSLHDPDRSGRAAGVQRARDGRRVRADPEFEADLIRARTREGMKVANAKGRLRGKQPKLTPRQEATLSPGTGPASPPSSGDRALHSLGGGVGRRRVLRARTSAVESGPGNVEEFACVGCTARARMLSARCRTPPPSVYVDQEASERVRDGAVPTGYPG